MEITLQDINDNPPVFPTDMLDLTVEENIGDGSKIMQLTAMDADEVGALLHVKKMLFWRCTFYLFLYSLHEGLRSHCATQFFVLHLHPLLGILVSSMQSYIGTHSHDKVPVD